MAKNYEAIHVYGDEASTVWIRRKGNGDGSIPTGLAAPEEASGFQDGGWLSEDGIDLELAVEVEKFKGWQGGTNVKNRVTSTERTFVMQFLQEDPLSTEIFWDHDGITGEDGLAKYTIPKSVGYSEWEFIVDFIDAGKTKRLVCSASAGERGTVSHKNDDMTIYEVTFDMVDDGYVITDDPTMVAAIPAGDSGE